MPIITRFDQQDITRTPDTLPVVLSLHRQLPGSNWEARAEACLAFLLAINTDSNPAFDSPTPTGSQQMQEPTGHSGGHVSEISGPATLWKQSIWLAVFVYEAT